MGKGLPSEGLVLPSGDTALLQAVEHFLLKRMPLFSLLAKSARNNHDQNKGLAHQDVRRSGSWPVVPGGLGLALRTEVDDAHTKHRAWGTIARENHTHSSKPAGNERPSGQREG